MRHVKLMTAGCLTKKGQDVREQERVSGPDDAALDILDLPKYERASERTGDILISYARPLARFVRLQRASSCSHTDTELS